MITVTTQFKLSKAGRKANLPDRPSDLLPIDPNKCYQLGTGGDFRWIDVVADDSPLDPESYVKDVLQRRSRFLSSSQRSGKYFELVSCQIEIGSLVFDCKIIDGK